MTSYFAFDTIKFPQLDPLIPDEFQEQHTEAVSCVLNLIFSPLLIFLYDKKICFSSVGTNLWYFLETPQQMEKKQVLTTKQRITNIFMALSFDRKVKASEFIHNSCTSFQFLENCSLIPSFPEITEWQPLSLQA